MAGTFAALDAALNGDEPNVKSKLVIFDPAVFKRTRAQLGDYDASRSEWNDVYTKFKSDWEAGAPAARDKAASEVGFLDKFYNGDFAGYLSGLRSKEADAKRAAGDRALAYATGSGNRAALLRGDPSGGGSAGRAFGYRAARDIEDNIALSDIARERSDFDYLNRSQQANIGLRTNIADAVLKRRLLPHQLNDQELSSAIQQLSGIQGIRMGAAQPVFWNERSDLARYGEGAEIALDNMNNQLSMAMSAYQGGGYTPNSTNPSVGSNASGYMGAQTTPYSAGVSYDNPAPSGGTSFNYGPYNPANSPYSANYGNGAPSVNSSGGYSAGMSYSGGYGGGGGDGGADWEMLSSIGY